MHIFKGLVIKSEDCVLNSADIFHVMAMLVLITQNENSMAFGGMMSVLNAMKISLRLSDMSDIDPIWDMTLIFTFLIMQGKLANTFSCNSAISESNDVYPNFRSTEVLLRMFVSDDPEYIKCFLIRNCILMLIESLLLHICQYMRPITIFFHLFTP